LPCTWHSFQNELMWGFLHLNVGHLSNHLKRILKCPFVQSSK
jgi:hypothetical protein